MLQPYFAAFSLSGNGRNGKVGRKKTAGCNQTATCYTDSTMLTTDDFEQLGKLIDTRLDAKLDEKLKPIKEDLEKLDKKVDRLTEDMADFFNETWKKMGESDQKIQVIEEHVGLSPRI